MNKPKDYDNTPAYGEYSILPAGGYICRIMDVKEGTDRNGQATIDVSLDIAEGLYNGYYSQQWKNDRRIDKKWGCVVKIWVFDKDGNTSGRFKTFCEAAEKSNSGFHIAWGDYFERCFNNKLIGGLFRREEYMKTDGSAGKVTRCIRFMTVEAVKNRKFTVPEDKTLAYKNDYGTENSNNYSGFATVASDISGQYSGFSEDDLPF